MRIEWSSFATAFTKVSAVKKATDDKKVNCLQFVVLLCNCSIIHRKGALIVQGSIAKSLNLCDFASPH